MTDSSQALHRNPVVLVFGCTILGAAAQILMKTGANRLGGSRITEIFTSGQAFLSYLVQIATNMPVMTGYCLLGMSTMLLTLALRRGQLSLLYPVISLTYVWVTLLSVFVLKETMNPFKAIGLATIVCGVGVLGRGDRS